MMIYFILGLMCLFIGGHYLQHAHYKADGSAIALVILGFIILLVLTIRLVRQMVTYTDPTIQEKERQKNISE